MVLMMARDLSLLILGRAASHSHDDKKLYCDLLINPYRM